MVTRLEVETELVLLLKLVMNAELNIIQSMTLTTNVVEVGLILAVGRSKTVMVGKCP